MPKKLTLTELILQAMESSGQTRYRIAKETGLSQAALSRFVHGERGLSLQSLETLLNYLGLEVRPKGK
jgi:predicted transcriptional regulator